MASPAVVPPGMLATMRNVLGPLTILGTLGCMACGGTTESGASTAGSAAGAASAGTDEATGAGPAAAGAGSPGAAGFEVHEWALVDVLDGGTTELAGGPGHPPPTMSVRKPVLYVHLPDGTDELSFALDARMTSGSILEHWPAGMLDGGHVHWDAVARRAHCDTVVSTAARGRWATPEDGVTELPDLPTYDAADAACLTVGTETAGLLFYRGTMTAPTLPLSVARGADFSVTVTATGDTTGMPGEILRLSTNLSGPWPVGHVVLSRAAIPAAGASVSLPVGTVAVDPTAESATLAAAMVSLGMTQPEADAFTRAWRESLFGAGSPDDAARRESRDMRSPVAPPGPPQDSILFWLPPTAADTIATLAIAPTPAAVRRVFLVRVTLSAVDTALLGAPSPHEG